MKVVAKQKKKKKKKFLFTSLANLFTENGETRKASHRREIYDYRKNNLLLPLISLKLYGTYCFTVNLPRKTKYGFIGGIFSGVKEKSPLMVIFSVFFTILLYQLFGGSRCVAVQESTYF